MTKPTFIPRPSQQEIVDNLLGKNGNPVRLGVSAAPGSGKTYILSYLASRLVEQVGDNQEVLIVTLVNSAVNNFRRRVDGFVRKDGLLPGFNYRVCTLHSLTNEIVRQRPSLVGLTHDFDIVDERTTNFILREVVDNWLVANVSLLEDYFQPNVNIKYLLRKGLPELVLSIADTFIKQAKDRCLAPHQLEEAYRLQTDSLPLAQLGIDIYRDYQNRLARTGVDFADLIRLAYQAIELDPDFLARLQQRWPYILEDEAQDSSLLQEKILDKLAGVEGTWVRVGDPNQAIYETFTTANPENLRRFLCRDGVISLPMPESGRSSPQIIALANRLIDWTMTEHPRIEVQDALNIPHIEPTPIRDPQPNPPDVKVELYDRKLTSKKEIEIIVSTVKRWLKENKGKTVAILDARNKRGVDIANALRRANIPYVELLNSTAATRSIAGVLGNLLKHLADPTDPKQLAVVFKAWQRFDWDKEQLQPIFEAIEQAIQKCPHLEDYLYPRLGRDWLDSLGLEEWYFEKPVVHEQDEDEENIGKTDCSPASYFSRFRDLVKRWQNAAILPIDQLILLLAQELFDSPSELALAHKFAVVLRQQAANNPSDRLPQFVEALAEIARNQRRFLGFDEESLSFEPPVDKVTVATMHKAKGLEWDRVYLMGVNNYGFPSVQPQDTYMSERYFVRDSLNLEAEVMAQLEKLSHNITYIEGTATEHARLKIARERLRLFYVGITRAKQELIITWNTGRKTSYNTENQPSIPFVALSEWLKNGR